MLAGENAVLKSKSSSFRPDPSKLEAQRDSPSYANPSSMSPLIFNSSINKNSTMKKNLNIDITQPTFNYFSKSVVYSQPKTTLANTSLNKMASNRATPINNFPQTSSIDKRENLNEVRPIVKTISNTPVIDSKKDISSTVLPVNDVLAGIKSNSFVGVFPSSRISPANKNLYNNSFATAHEKKFEFQNNASNVVLPNQEPTKFSVKKNGVVKAYAANTNQGIVRNYNEDRVSIILNIMKPNNRGEEDWPKCSFFGVYDGHGGTLCADYLRDLLHQYVIKDPNFPWNPKEALRKGFELAEKNFFSFYCENAGSHEKSGSCAIVVLIVGDMCYVANVGDSRAVMSGEGGTKVYPLSRDHKPLDEIENKRILDAGGKIYQTKASANSSSNGDSKGNNPEIIIGPYRVFPGRLSVTRTFGDVEAKDPRFGGNPNVVISTPDIKSFKITKDHDFIVLGSDGIFDKLSSREVIQCVWDSTSNKQKNIHEQCAKGVESILKEAILKKTIDNITIVVIGFSNFKKKIFPRAPKEKDDKNNLSKMNNSIETNFNTTTNHTSSDYSTFFYSEKPKTLNSELNNYNNNKVLNSEINNFTNNENHAKSNNKQIPEEKETNEKIERNLHMALERTVKNPFNPFLNSPLTKSKPEYLNNLRMMSNNSHSMNPLLTLKTSKAEALKSNERVKTFEDKGWEIKKDILNGKVSYNG